MNTFYYFFTRSNTFHIQVPGTNDNPGNNDASGSGEIKSPVIEGAKSPGTLIADGANTYLREDGEINLEDENMKTPKPKGNFCIYVMKQDIYNAIIRECYHCV